MATIEREYAELLGYRQGARYYRMDLHTHTPASECSSFTLPKVIEAAFPREPKNAPRAWHDQRYALLCGIGDGTSPFRAPYGDEELKSRPRVAKRPPLDDDILACIAAVWLDDIRQACPGLGDKPPAAEKDRRDKLVALAFQDIERYLASLFFPEEFVLRCHIEGLQLVALTDHNHPGTIVPRLPELGTWYTALCRVNQAYQRDLGKARNAGEAVRQAMLARLALAKQRLASAFDEASRADRETRDNHKESVQKRLKGLRARQQHVDERIQFWQSPENVPQRLTLLPGTEITVSNVHLLTVYPPQWYVPGRIGSILRAIGIPEEHWGKGFFAAASASVQDTIDLVHAEGGIAIPAHANSDFKGLLRLFRKGLALRKVLEHPALLCLESVGGSILAGDKKGKDACDTLKELDSPSWRNSRRKPLCFIKGSDAHECRIELDGTGEDLGMRFTHVKMDIRSDDTPEEVFRSLRLALLSGQSRIVESPTEDGYNYAAAKGKHRVDKADRAKLLDPGSDHPVILGVTASGRDSYTGGVDVSFNPHLNCVVGSGGKSSLVRLVGYAFGAQGFLPTTAKSWLPERVRAYWREGDRVFCVEREGRAALPGDAAVAATLWERGADGVWTAVAQSPDPRIDALSGLVEVWPPVDVQDGKRGLSKLESRVVAALVRALYVPPGQKTTPLLVNQPRDIFNSRELFEQVLSKPLLKTRQIIWSTGSPNVPTTLDAEKIIVTEEVARGKRVAIRCAGDLHEDEIRDAFVNCFEGGWLGFARRADLYA